MAISVPIEVGAGGRGDLAGGAMAVPKGAAPLIGAPAQTRSATTGTPAAAYAGSFRSSWQSMLASLASGKTADQTTETEDAALEERLATDGNVRTNAGSTPAALSLFPPTVNSASQTGSAQPAAQTNRASAQSANSTAKSVAGNSAPQESAGSEETSASSAKKSPEKEKKEAAQRSGEQPPTAAQNSTPALSTPVVAPSAMAPGTVNRQSARAASMKGDSADSILESTGTHPAFSAMNLTASGQSAASGMQSASRPGATAHPNAQTGIQLYGSVTAASTQNLDIGSDSEAAAHDGFAESANAHSPATEAQPAATGNDGVTHSIAQSGHSSEFSGTGTQPPSGSPPAGTAHTDASRPQTEADNAESNSATNHPEAQGASHAVRITGISLGGAGLAQMAATPSSTAVDPVLLAHTPTGAHGAVHAPAQGSVTASGGAAGISAGTGSRETFAALDAQPAAGTPGWIHARSQSAEAGFEDPVLGWVGVRADLTAGGVHAALVPSTDQASQMLTGHMAGLNAHLAAEHIRVASLNMAAATGNASVGTGQTGTGAMQQGTGQGQGQNGHQGGSFSGSMDSGLGNSAGAPATRGELRESGLTATRMQPLAWTGTAASGTYISVVA